jgi:hypothetical protein
MTATSLASETTLGIDTKFCFVGRSWGQVEVIWSAR